MSLVTETICDRCGTRKGSTNGWWTIYVDAEQFSVLINYEGTRKDIKDFCSEGCVNKALQEVVEEFARLLP